MKPPIKILLASLVSFSMATALAANKTILIELEVTHPPYVSLLGSAVGISKFFSVDDIKPLSGDSPLLTIGLLGLESNISGNCTLNFASNKFTLRRIPDGKRLTTYRLKYDGVLFDKKNTSLVLKSCNKGLSPLEFQRTGDFGKKVQAGIYQDIVTITVTTQ